MRNTLIKLIFASLAGIAATFLWWEFADQAR